MWAVSLDILKFNLVTKFLQPSASDLVAKSWMLSFWPAAYDKRPIRQNTWEDFKRLPILSPQCRHRYHRHHYSEHSIIRWPLSSPSRLLSSSWWSLIILVRCDSSLVSCPTRLSSSWWWRPQIADFEKCSIWELLHLRIAPFEKCSIWELLHLRIVEFEKCWIWELSGQT